LPADGGLPIEKVFRRDGGVDSGVTYVVTAVRVPFCPACIARHQVEAVTVSPLQRVLLCFRQPVIISALTMGVLALYLAPRAIDAVSSADGAGGLIFLGIVLLFSLIAAASGFAAFDQSRRHAVVPATSVTSAFDYSDDQSELFDRERRTYRLGNPAFAEAFLHANQHRQWNPGSPRAAAGRWLRTALTIMIVVAGVVMLVSTLL
jgi:hypothetical protein